MAKQIFVTGASGFIGRELCYRLAQEGNQVLAFMRPGHKSFHHPSIEEIEGDLLSPETYRVAIARAEIVFHLAAEARFGSGSAFNRTNVDGTRLLLQESAHVEKFVFVSSISALERSPADFCQEPLNEDTIPCPRTDYGKSKLEAEKIVQASRLNWSILRPALVVGKGMRLKSHVRVWVTQALEKKGISKMNFPGKFSVVHVSDLVSALILLSQKAEATQKIFLAGGEPISLGEIFKIANPTQIQVPVSWLTPILRPLIGWLPLQAKAIFFDAFAVDDNRLQALGWKPQFSAAQSVEIVRRFVTQPGKALITGAASGLGLAIAKRLLSEGRELIVIDKDSIRLQAQFNSTPARQECRDLSLDSELESLAKAEWWSELSEVFLIAGMGAYGKTVEIELDKIRSMIQTNFLARVTLARRAAKEFSKIRAGKIILISSSSAFQPLGQMGVYAATNSAVLSFGMSLWAEMKDRGVQVLTVCPGGMRTNFQQSAGVRVLPKDYLESPERVANSILKAIRKKEALLIFGFPAKVMSWTGRFFPLKLNTLLWSRLMLRLR